VLVGRGLLLPRQRRFHLGMSNARPHGCFHPTFNNRMPNRLGEFGYSNAHG
jgi:hypothetical protein